MTAEDTEYVLPADIEDLILRSEAAHAAAHRESLSNAPIRLLSRAWSVAVSGAWPRRAAARVVAPG